MNKVLDMLANTLIVALIIVGAVDILYIIVMATKPTLGTIGIIVFCTALYSAAYRVWRDKL